MKKFACEGRFWIVMFCSMLLLAALQLTELRVAAQEGATPAKDPVGAYNIAVNMHNDGDYELAATKWERFLTDFPTDKRVGKVKYYLGVCYFKNTDYDKAITIFEDATENHPDLAMMEQALSNLCFSRYNQALLKKDKKLFAKAAADFEKLLKKYPDGGSVADALYHAGESYLNTGDYDKAAAKYAQLAKDFPNDTRGPQASMGLAFVQAKNGETEEALKTYNNLLTKYEGAKTTTEIATALAEAKVWRGDLLFKQKKFREAAADFAAALEDKNIASTNLADYAALRFADALNEQKQFAEAGAAYESLVKDYPKSQYASVATLEAGRCFYNAKDYAQALAYLDKVIAKKNPKKDVQSAALLKLNILVQQKKSDEADKFAKEFGVEMPEGEGQAQFLLAKANITFDQGDFAKATNEFAELANQYPKSPVAPDAYYMAAFSAMKSGQLETAKPYAAAFVERFKDHRFTAPVKHILAECLLKEKDYTGAAKLFQEILKSTPDDPDVEIWKTHLGTALYLAGQYDEAIAALTPVVATIKNKPLAAEAYYRLARSYVAKGQNAKAIAPLEKSLAAETKWLLADDAQLLLAYLYQGDKKFAEAKAAAQKVLDAKPKDRLAADALFRIAECDRLDGNYKEAAASYEKVVTDHPKSNMLEHCYYGLTLAYDGLKDSKGVTKYCTAYLEAFPKGKQRATLLYRRGFANYKEKNYKEATADLTAYLEKPGKDAATAQHLLGLAQIRGDKVTDGIASLEKLLEDNPKYKDADGVLYEIVLAYKKLGKTKEADAASDRLAKEFPESNYAGDAIYLAAGQAFKAKDFKKAASLYYKAMTAAQGAENAALAEEACYNLSLSYFSQKDWKRAEEMFAYLLENWPKTKLASEANYFLGEVQFNQDNYTDALDSYAKVKKIDSKEMQEILLLHWAFAAREAKESEVAQEKAAALIEQFPKTKFLDEGYYIQGWAFKQGGDNAKARKAFTDGYNTGLANRTEAAAKCLFMIAEMDLADKKYTQAIERFIDVDVNYPYPKWQAKACYEAARCYEFLKKTPQAIRRYEKVVKNYADSEEAPLAKERLGQLK